MGFIQDLVAKRRQRNLKESQLYEDDRLIERLHEKKQSHGERELIKSLQEEKQKVIGETLKWDNKRRTAEEKLKARGMMKFNSELFDGDTILKEKNLFLRGGDF